MKQASKFCWRCNSHRLFVATPPNHILHLILSVVTLGTWLIVWSWICVFSGGYRCQSCGSNESWWKSRKARRGP